MRVRRADWVTTNTGGHGFVKRVAGDGSWADVLWREPGMDPPEWVKRMRTDCLIVRHTLPLPGGWTVTDMTRQEELEAERPRA